MERQLPTLITNTAKNDYDSVTDPKMKKTIDRIIEKIKLNPRQYSHLSPPLNSLRAARTFSFQILYHVGKTYLVICGISKILNNSRGFTR